MPNTTTWHKQGDATWAIAVSEDVKDEACTSDGSVREPLGPQGTSATGNEHKRDLRRFQGEWFRSHPVGMAVLILLLLLLVLALGVALAVQAGFGMAITGLGCANELRVCCGGAAAATATATATRLLSLTLSSVSTWLPRASSVIPAQIIGCISAARPKLPCNKGCRKDLLHTGQCQLHLSAQHRAVLPQLHHVPCTSSQGHLSASSSPVPALGWVCKGEVSAIHPATDAAWSEWSALITQQDQMGNPHLPGIFEFVTNSLNMTVLGCLWKRKNS
ncbi:uncharacterized protein LOC103823744 isoform X2 [Serinus canaria]|uniref:uncharacterized protein LOC103823744 isoform X2 n=1 Tax=Serinus canaria TaxID=9135 RepID=UPI0021CC4EC2|nr:uncharacterized protein LOC103823744 isoform X2 [Serinus canaria]